MHGNKRSLKRLGVPIYLAGCKYVLQPDDPEQRISILSGKNLVSHHKTHRLQIQTNGPHSGWRIPEK